MSVNSRALLCALVLLWVPLAAGCPEEVGPGGSGGEGGADVEDTADDVVDPDATDVVDPDVVDPDATDLDATDTIDSDATDTGPDCTSAVCSRGECQPANPALSAQLASTARSAPADSTAQARRTRRSPVLLAPGMTTPPTAPCACLGCASPLVPSGPAELNHAECWRVTR